MMVLPRFVVSLILSIYGLSAYAIAQQAPGDRDTDIAIDRPRVEKIPDSMASVYENVQTEGSSPLTKADVTAWLDGYIPYAIASGDIVGAVVTIVKDGEVFVNRGFGYADLEKRLPVDPETTLFRPGSTSKLFTWTAVMQLVEQGKLDLDQSIATYLDFSIPMPRGDITLRHILTHTPGFEEVLRDLILTNLNSDEDYLRNYLAENVPAQIYAPGDVPAYSNYATALAGYIVQVVSGERFDDYIENHIFRPLGMTGSAFRQPLPDDLERNLSRGYKSLSDGEPQPFEMISAAPAGSLSSTGSDMARFMIAFLEEGRGLLRPETARLMHETIDSHFPPLNAMALGFYQQNRNGLRIVGHGGDTTQFHTDMALILDKNIGIFFSMNSSGAGPVTSLIRENLLSEFVDRYFPVDEVERPALETAMEHGRAVAGTYEESRRAAMSAFATLFMTSQTKVSVNDAGELVFLFLPDLNGADKKWREVEPWVWQAKGGKDRLAARVVDGRVVAFAAEPASPFMMYTPVPWWRSSVWLIPAVGVAAGFFLLTLLAWPARAFARWRFGASFPFEGARALVHRLTPAVSFVVLAYIAGWAGYLAWALADMDNLGADKSRGWLMLLYGAAIPLLACVAAMGWANFVVWRDNGSWFAKLGAAVLMAAVLTVIWFAWVGKLLSFDMNY